MAEHQDKAVEEAPLKVQFRTSLVAKLNLTSHQNAMPFLREVRIVDDTEDQLRDLILTSEPAFLTIRSWHMDEVKTRQPFHLADLDAGGPTR